MPSDDRFTSALAALASARAAYLSAVAATHDEVTTLLAAAKGAETGGGERAALELGSLGAGRIDVERFATLFASGPALDAAAERALERARALLGDLLARHDSIFHLRVESGDDVRAAVAAALALSGRAFGAARAAELARGGRYREAEHAVLFEPFSFRLWTRQERRLAPPLVVEVHGSDLSAAFLADYMDGAQKIVLLVSGAMPPAPLVRLITPDVAVAQIADVKALARLGAHDGAGVFAVVEDGDAALFVHDPSAGASVAERLAIERLPSKEPRGGAMRSSPFQRTQELKQLKELQTLVAAAGAGAGISPAAPNGVATSSAATDGAVTAGQPEVAAPVIEPADRLAAWLLREAQLAEPGG
jgi:hypothetical protein